MHKLDDEQRKRNSEIFLFLMRKLNDIAIKCEKDTSIEILKIMSQLENIHHFPVDIRKVEDYQ